MSIKLTPFIKWYPPSYSTNHLVRWSEKTFGRIPSSRHCPCIVRGHGLGEDLLYLCGDKPARYPVPTTIGDTEIEESAVFIWAVDDPIDVLRSWDAPPRYPVPTRQLDDYYPTQLIDFLFTHYRFSAKKWLAWHQWFYGA